MSMNHPFKSYDTMASTKPKTLAEMTQELNNDFGPDYTPRHYTESEEQDLFEKLRQADVWWEERFFKVKCRQIETFDCIRNELENITDKREHMYAFSLFQDTLDLKNHTILEVYDMYAALDARFGKSARFADMDAPTQEQVLKMIS